MSIKSILRSFQIICILILDLIRYVFKLSFDWYVQLFHMNIHLSRAKIIYQIHWIKVEGVVPPPVRETFARDSNLSDLSVRDSRSNWFKWMSSILRFIVIILSNIICLIRCVVDSATWCELAYPSNVRGFFCIASWLDQTLRKSVTKIMSVTMNCLFFIMSTSELYVRTGTSMGMIK